MVHAQGTLGMNFSWEFSVETFILIIQWHDKTVPSEETSLKLNLVIAQLWSSLGASISNAMRTWERFTNCQDSPKC